MSESSPSVLVSRPDEGRASLRERFNALADEWIAATRLSSSVIETCMHPAYQQIIGLGPAVLPLVLEDVAQGELHWGWALRALTGHDAAEGAETLPQARDAWARWGREAGLLR